jgi:heat shock protein HtpX
VPAPRLYTIPSEQPNAFATGRNLQHAAVAVTEGLLQHLPPEQVKSVLAHEFGHIKNRDILVSSIAALVAAAIANVFQFSLLFGGEDEDAGAVGWIGLLATIIVAPVAASLLQLAVSRQPRVPRRRDRSAVPRPRGAARRRPRDAAREPSR